MKVIGAVLVCGGLLLSTGYAFGADKPDGKVLFETMCTICHKDGGNLLNSKKTLRKADREANGVKTADDIVGLMRKPGTGMTKFGKGKVPDKEAKAIAEYVIKTY